ncbi:MAG: prepilin peptidase [Chloroflexaceae bacterium]|nr:prepilin peptidase [Chloroflexaceae bacterium]
MILVFVAGLFLGVLLNLVIIRLPLERNSVGGWPRCTRTGQPLAWWQLLPLVGWLLQRGKASNGKALHWVYPLVEMLTAVTITWLYATYGLSWFYGYLVFITSILIVTGAIDWLHRFIYTFVVLGAVVLALGATLLLPDLNIAHAGMGALVAGGVFILLFLLAQFLFPARSAPFGLGDVYLGIFIGAAVGLPHLAPSLFYGVLMAGFVAVLIVIGKYLLRRRDLPEYLSYGTYLCLGVIVYLLTHDIRG